MPPIAYAVLIRDLLLPQKDCKVEFPTARKSSSTTVYVMANLLEMLSGCVLDDVEHGVLAPMVGEAGAAFESLSVRYSKHGVVSVLRGSLHFFIRQNSTTKCSGGGKDVGVSHGHCQRAVASHRLRAESLTHALTVGQAQYIMSIWPTSKSQAEAKMEYKRECYGDATQRWGTNFSQSIST